MSSFCVAPLTATKVLVDLSTCIKANKSIKENNLLLKQIFLWPIYMCFFDFWWICVCVCDSGAARCISLLDRVGKGRGGVGLEGAEDVEGMNLGGKP